MLTAPSATSAAAVRCSASWHGAWAASPLGVAGDDPILPADLANATLRQTVRLTGGGDGIRIRISNLMGRTTLRIDHIRVGAAEASGDADVDPGRLGPVLFSGQDAVQIPAGADYVSDPLAGPVTAGTILSISIHLPDAPSAITSHPGSRTTSWLVSGERASDSALSDGRAMDHWYFLSGVDVHGCGTAIVALGDSITDGHGATTNGDDRWTDELAARLQADQPGTFSVLNEGIGGNRVLLDGLGPNAIARFDRDVLAQGGAHIVIVLEGINDLGTLTRDGAVSAAAHMALTDHLIAAYRQIIARAHAHGMTVIGATILPDGGSDYYHPDAQNEVDRQRVNSWIRAPGHFDGLVDFDAAMRDPTHPDHLLPAYDSGDHLHPNPAGYRRMAQAVPPGLLQSSRSGRFLEKDPLM